MRPRNDADGDSLLKILLDIQERIGKVEEKLNSIDEDIKELKGGLSGQRSYTDEAVSSLKQDIIDRLEKVEEKLDELDKRVQRLEQFRASVSATSSFADKLIGFIIGALSTLVAWLAYIKG